MTTVLPREIDYSKIPAPIPDGTQNTSVVCVPSNGPSFGASQVIMFDLISRGYLIPSSLYIRFKITTTSATTANNFKAVPLYTVFQKSEIYCGSQCIETISQYNALMMFIVNTRLNCSQKLSPKFGFIDSTGSTAPSFVNLNGRASTSTGESFFVSGPLVNILSNADNYIPLELIPALRIQLTVDSLSSMFNGTYGASAIKLENMELCYDVVQFNGEVSSIVKSMGDANGNITIKSSGFSLTSQTLPINTAGSVELVYNSRFSSIRSLATLFGRNSSNTWGDAVDPTSNGGGVSWTIAGIQYPPREISTVLNKMGILSELATFWNAVGEIDSANMSISTAEFSKVSSATASDTTYAVPGKVYFATNVEACPTNSVLLSGVSTNNSPISVRMNCSTATAESHLVSLIVYYDALLQINLASNQLVVKQ